MSEITAVNNNMASQYIKDALSTKQPQNANADDTFSSLLSSAMDMINNTNDLQNASNAAQMNFALGYSDNTHDLAVAQEKAALSLQYTVAVKNKVLDAYKEIMNIQV